MTAYQIFVLAAILSLPVVGLVTIKNAVIFGFRAYKTADKRYVLLSLLCVVLITATLTLAVAVLFIYGVSHGQKDLESDLIVLAVILLPTYVCAASFRRIVANATEKLRDGAS